MNKKVITIVVAVLLLAAYVRYGVSKGEISADDLARLEDSTEERQPEMKEFIVDANNFSFSPTELRVKRGDSIKITLVSGEGFHDFVVEEFNARSASVNTRQETVIEYVADKEGEFEFYCSVGNHRQMGMRGKLIVE